MRKQFFTMAAMLCFTGFAAAETIDNPEFANWSKFNKGTSVTHKSTATTAGNTSETLMTSTLLEKSADKLVIETEIVTKVAGQEFKSPATKRDVTKTIEVPKGTKKEDLTGEKPKGTTEEGSETLKVAGKEFKTKWYRMTAEAAGLKSDTKMWRCDDIPGMMVKMESTTTGASESTVKMEVVELKMP